MIIRDSKFQSLGEVADVHVSGGRGYHDNRVEAFDDDVIKVRKDGVIIPTSVDDNKPNPETYKNLSMLQNMLLGRTATSQKFNELTKIDPELENKLVKEDNSEEKWQHNFGDLRERTNRLSGRHS